jgi:hypothetical protein
MGIRNHWAVSSWGCCRGRGFGRKVWPIGRSWGERGFLFSFFIMSNG